ncbi:hypothetical protein DFJ73DRAFT_960155 [Zopfochytrium polystomum]|nr:hypothetical protein DFJ73DRAFT_960155 [Zopfochytrium polystomum]
MSANGEQSTDDSVVDGLLVASLANLTQSSQFLATPDLLFFKSLSDDLSASLATSGRSLLSLCNSVLATASFKSAFVQDFENVDDVWERFDTVTEVIDGLLEHADTSIDKLRGIHKRNNLQVQSAPIVVQLPSTPSKGHVAKDSAPATAIIHAQNILRPQLRFEDKVDNTNGVPFVSKLKFKDNSKSTPTSLEGSEINAHPYAYEIETIEYPEHELEIRPEVLFRPLDDVPCTWVDTVEKLADLVRLLETVTEIAVDLEHHDYRSYQGFTCLIQLSTRNEDFIIDALELRSHLYQLNRAFSNPKIVKVLHGGEMDVIWLQRDFGVYIVNLFDTYHASHVLEMAGHGFAYLLKYYCDVDTNKKYQLADWRISILNNHNRPLPKEMLKYARMDTHYLLYIYDRMRNEILGRTDPETKQLLYVSLKRSEQTSLRHYQKEVYDASGEGPNGWRTSLRKVAQPLTPQNLAVYAALHGWRDEVAREEDESPRYILPNHMLQAAAFSMPTTLPELLACCRPVVPNAVRVRAADVLHVIEEARAKYRKDLLSPTGSTVHSKLPKAPSHIRFDEATPVEASSLTSKKPAPRPSKPRDSVAAASRAGHVIKVKISVKSDLTDPWGSLTSSNRSEEDSSESVLSPVLQLDLAHEIRESLVLEAPLGPWLDIHENEIESGSRESSESPSAEKRKREAGDEGDETVASPSSTPVPSKPATQSTSASKKALNIVDGTVAILDVTGKNSDGVTGSIKRKKIQSTTDNPASEKAEPLCDCLRTVLLLIMVKNVVAPIFTLRNISSDNHYQSLRRVADSFKAFAPRYDVLRTLQYPLVQAKAVVSVEICAELVLLDPNGWIEIWGCGCTSDKEQLVFTAAATSCCVESTWRKSVVKRIRVFKH